jgi:hypothetical protein
MEPLRGVQQSVVLNGLQCLAERQAFAEATVPQIATFTGHSLKDVEAILDAHYLGRDVQLAEAAVLKLEREQNCKPWCKMRLILAGTTWLSA